jgi:hypothetical protein
MGSTKDFVPRVLQGVTRCADSTFQETDAALEMRLSTWMRQAEVEVAEALDAMVLARGAILQAGDMDPRTEPIPLTGRSPEVDLLAWANYLASLLERAAASMRCETRVIVKRTIRHLAA